MLKQRAHPGPLSLVAHSGLGGSVTGLPLRPGAAAGQGVAVVAGSAGHVMTSTPGSAPGSGA